MSLRKNRPRVIHALRLLTVPNAVAMNALGSCAEARRELNNHTIPRRNGMRIGIVMGWTSVVCDHGELETRRDRPARNDGGPSRMHALPWYESTGRPCRVQPSSSYSADVTGDG